MSTIVDSINSLTAAAQGLTNTVNTKIEDIDNRVDEKCVEVDTFLANALASIEGPIAALDTRITDISARVDATQTEVDNFLANTSPETRYVQEVHIGGSTDFLYPLWWRFPDNNFGPASLAISRHFSTNSDTRPLDPTRPHQATLYLELEGNGHAFAGDTDFLEVKRFFERYNNTSSHLGFKAYCIARPLDPSAPLSIHSNEGNGQFAFLARNDSGVFLRGGGLTYRIVKNWAGDVSFHDGSDMNERIIGNDTFQNVQWFTRPIPFTDLLSPVGDRSVYNGLLP